MNRMTIADTRMVAFMKKMAKQQKINFQIEAMDAGGTDASAMQMMTAHGCITGGISVPLRNMHQEVEMCHKADIAGTMDLLQACLENIDKGDWKQD